MRRVTRGLLAGLAGTAAMTTTTVAEMRLRGRGASTAPVRAAERATGVRLPSDRARRAASWAGHVPFGVATGLLRPVVGGPLAFVAVAWLPDLLVVPALDASTPPPWRWGAEELALSALHHVAYATAAEVVWRASS